MNSVVLMGRLTKDVDLRKNGNISIGMFSVAVSKKDGVNFINCKCFGNTAENLARFFKKGDMICVQGCIDVGSYTNKENKKINTFDILVREFSFCGSKSSQNQSQNFTVATDSEDIPF